MFDVDRFSDGEDFGATYRQIGGRALGEDEVRRIISGLFDKMLADSRNPAYYGRFPSVLTCLEGMPESKDLPKGEIALLERVFAIHEIGTVPDTHAEILRRLRETHRLGVVSDIWSKSDLYLQEFTRAGIRDLFHAIVFSSDHGYLKPSAYPFAKAVQGFNVGRSKIVFVGDSLRRDIAGAKGAGLSAVWIGTDLGGVDDGHARPDWAIKDLRDLLEC
jgi:FMN phosphatase YigB (HAD superfamily)